MYYVMTCPDIVTEFDEGLLAIQDGFIPGNARNWGDGQAYGPDTEVPNPIEIPFERFQDYDGPPPEMSDSLIPVMSKRLREALDGAGIDNIQYYPAVLVDAASGERHEVFAFKVIGLVKAMDREESDFFSFDGDMLLDTSIQGLSIDEEAAQGLLLFRLAENTAALIVHEKIKAQVEAAGIDAIEFIDPEDFVQL